MTYCKTKPQTINTSNFYIDVKKARLKAKYSKKLNYVHNCSNGRDWLNMFETFTCSDNSPI